MKVYKIKNNNKYTGNSKDMIAFSKWLIKKLDINLYQSKLYFRFGNKYISDDRLLLQTANIYQELKKSQDKEILHQIEKFSNDISNNLSELPIILNNGFIFDGEYFNKKISTFSPFFLDVDYVHNAYDEYVDHFLNDITCNCNELRMTLEEILGHIILTHKFPAHVFFLLGNGNNGKSTFLEMINNLVQDLGQNLNLDAFNDDTSVATLRGKLCNCSDEIDNICIDKCKGYKSLASGNTITVRPIYSAPIKLKNTSTLILSANKMPTFQDKSDGFFRRLVIIPFNYKVQNKISNLDNLLSTSNAKSYILRLALSGATRIKNNNYEISQNQYIKDEINKYILESDTIASYIEEYSDIHGKTTQYVYNKYKDYCKDNGFFPINKIQFSKRLHDFGFISQPRNNIRYYFKESK